MKDDAVERVMKQLMIQAGFVPDLDGLTVRGYAKWRARAEEIIAAFNG